ncbi:S-adenosyl-L-methionine-dependent methyltransferase [Mollisia scopiformis]|uniref:S-adenosyl-L-methionine-dependent methyltransferase n=1 Tax=Mollisia scopiformis TaxID=149040 RepID=A0A194X943_MOLSC|nr:S-adenosyl-L-methionine-dependent methyltransferase [Mollisia scopiformis]KUJ16688.1 S-adenosyl-L-methionine-dependent methyltransferase [Mollisia scopiformis]
MYQATPKQSAPEPGPQAIHHEWRTAENSATYVQSKLRSMKELKPNLTLLDVGAGSGTISITFAKAIPKGLVTAIDLNPDILTRAATVADSEGVTNIKFQQADAYKLPFADETFDITHCHQVLCHLKAPWGVLREMLRVTKPGGILAAREGDLETECVWPELPGLLRFHRLAVDIIKIGGGSTNAGRQLLSWALKAGAKREQATATFGTWCYSERADKDAWAQGIIKMVGAGRVHDLALKMGLATEDELVGMGKAWQEWQETDDATLGMLHGEILIQK